MTEQNIHTSEGNRGDVSVRLSYPMSNMSEERYASLEVTDKPSGQIIVKVEISANELVTMLAGGAANISNAVLAMYPGRIGKKLQTTKKAVHHSSLWNLDEESERLKAAFFNDGWQTVTINKTNYGRCVVAHRWIDEEAQAVLQSNPI